jgi:chemotaxis signal transduction protein
MDADPSFCLFRCGSLTLAVAVDDLAEVVETDSIVRISGCPPRIRGLCRYHRQVVPVVTLAPDPERPERRPACTGGRSEIPREAVLILQTAQGPWGIRIDRDGTSILSAQPDRRPPSSQGGFVSVGSVRQGETDFLLLDPASTWQALREQVVNWYAKLCDAPTGSSPWPPLPAGNAAAIQIDHEGSP